MINSISSTQFEFYCDGETHCFSFVIYVVFGFRCDCYKGTLADCPRCEGAGVILVNDGDGHMDTVDCPNNHLAQKR